MTLYGWCIMTKRFLGVLLILLIFALTLSACARGSVDKEYAYNTVIISNADAPVTGVADISKLEGYTEGTVEGFNGSYYIPDTDLEIISVGSYSGRYVEDLSFDPCEDLLALVVRNTSESIISYSSFSVNGSDDTMCYFTPTNLRPGCSALVLAGDKETKFSDIKSFEASSGMQVFIKELTMLDGTVGVSYLDGKFVVTNLTNQNLGSVYIRYKFITGANAYFGGVTCSTNIDNVEPYETYLISDDDFDDVQCEIISVENVIQE